ncbi:HET-domain-containing protein [Poronia punctata]|nr:HET-domain-containing protein [Poronia punctata]
MAVRDKSRYQYDRLPVETPTIRLLKVFSSDKSPITCSLQSFTLSEAPFFYALSYTWGDPLDQSLSSPSNRKPMSKELDKYVITEDGSTIGATENLIDALHMLSTMKNSQEEAYWWIDALCINQNDYEEKGTQVAMMDKVYDKAESVLIWLGREDEHTEGAMKILNGLADPRANVMEVSRRSWDADGYAAMDDIMIASDLLGFVDVEFPDWQDYAAFLQRNWFSRIWVVQEKFFARDTKILCGSYVVPWNRIMKSSEVLMHTGLNVLLKAVIDLTLSGDDYNLDTAAALLPDNRFDNQQIFSLIRKGNIDSIGLDKLLYCTRHFDATDARDKIYAIKGIWEDSQPVVDSQPTIRTDYSRTLGDVYADATVLAIRESKRLDILGLVEDPLSRKESELASWVPHFNGRPTMFPLRLALRQSVASQHWNASSGMCFKVPERIEGNQLLIDGVDVDEIVLVGPSYIEVMNKWKLGSLLQALADNKQPHYGSNKLSGEAFVRTLTKNTYAQKLVGEEALGAFAAFVMKRVQEFKSHINNLHARLQPDDAERFAQRLTELEVTLDELSGIFDIVPSAAETRRLISIAEMEGSKEEVELEDKRKAIEESIRLAYLGRRIFVTKQGCFGITSESVKQGDRVFILAGALTPHVLRRNKSDGKAQMVGEAYVDGLMEGEALSRGFHIERIILT